MKKVILWVMAIALLAGCAKEKDTNTVAPTNGNTYTITATIDNPETRTTAERFQDANTGSYKYSFKWETGERISVVPTNANRRLLFDLVDAESGTFSYTSIGGDEPEYTGFGLAVTPAEALLSLEPSITDYDIYFSGSYRYGHSNAIMVAGASSPDLDGSQKFQFKHIAALVKVTYKNVPAGAFAMVFEADHNIKGTFHFTSATGISASNDAFTEVEQDAPTESIVMFDEALDASLASAEFFVPIPIGQYQTFQVRLVGEDMETIPGSEQSWTASAPFSLNCADVVACPEVEVASTVSVVENFSSSKASNNKYECNSSLDTPANREDFDFTWNPTGAGTVFNNGIKLGKGTGTGAVASSDILSSFPPGSAFTVRVYAAAWNNDGGELIVSYNGTSLQNAPANSPITNTSEDYSVSDFTTPTEFVFMKTADADELSIASSSKRILIDKVEIVSGGTPAPVQSITVTPSSDNPELVPATGGTLSYSVSTTNIDSWDVVSNNTDFVVNKTLEGFVVVVAVNETSSPKSATIMVSGGNKSVEITINQAAGEGDSSVFPFVFTAKDWSATMNGGVANWISGKAGYAFESANSARGIQVTQAVSGANATSPVSFSGISSITVTLAKTTNGEGSVAVMVGNQTIGTQTSFTTTPTKYSFDVNNLSGEVKIVVTCTTNSIYVKGVSITSVSIGGEGGDGDGTEVEFLVGTDSSDQNTLQKDGISLTTTGGDWNRTDHYRIYAGATLTVSAPSDKMITGIVFSYEQNKFSTPIGALTDEGVWSGQAHSINFSTVGGQVRVTRIVVTYQ